MSGRLCAQVPWPVTERSVTDSSVRHDETHVMKCAQYTHTHTHKQAHSWVRGFLPDGDNIKRGMREGKERKKNVIHMFRSIVKCFFNKYNM